MARNFEFSTWLWIANEVFFDENKKGLVIKMAYYADIPQKTVVDCVHRLAISADS
jgi:hypothetical protein